jgi:mannonate dehydratase
MKITNAEVFIGGPEKNYVTLKIMTDQGIHGLGDATMNNRETLPAIYLRDYLIPNLIGMDPRNSEDIWQFFYRGAYFRRGPIAMAAFGAIDMALWDIKGKLANLPLYQLFGGKSREGALVYAHATGSDLEALTESVAHYVAEGYRAVRVQCGIPGMPTASYAVPELKDDVKNYITDFSGIRPETEVWNTGRYMRFMPGALAEIRDRFGPELHILHDVHQRGGTGPAILAGRPDAG